MDSKIFDIIYKSLFKEESKKYQKKKYTDKLFCHFCQKKITRSCRKTHELTKIHRENVENKRIEFEKSFKQIFLNNQSL